MTDFADAAARLAGLSGALLGWRPDEFWQATPEELSHILSALADLGMGGNPGATITRAALQQMMEACPDG